MACPLMIDLANAGCRQAGPKILSDLSARVSGCCKDLRNGRETPGWVRHPAARPGVPPRYAVPATGAARGPLQSRYALVPRTPHNNRKTSRFSTIGQYKDGLRPQADTHRSAGD